MREWSRHCDSAGQQGAYHRLRLRWFDSKTCYTVSKYLARTWKGSKCNERDQKRCLTAAMVSYILACILHTCSWFITHFVKSCSRGNNMECRASSKSEFFSLPFMRINPISSIKRDSNLLDALTALPLLNALYSSENKIFLYGPVCI